MTAARADDRGEFDARFGEPFILLPSSWWGLVRPRTLIIGRESRETTVPKSPLRTARGTRHRVTPRAIARSLPGHRILVNPGRRKSLPSAGCGLPPAAR